MTHNRLINYDNYKNLIVSIIQQACNDYNTLLKAEKMGYLDAAERKMASSKTSIEDFFNSNGGYFSYAELDGPTLLKQMQSNFESYGQAVLSPEDWDEIKKIEEMQNEITV